MKVKRLRLKLQNLVRRSGADLKPDDLLFIHALIATLQINDSKTVAELCSAMGLDFAKWFRGQDIVVPTNDNPAPVILVDQSKLESIRAQLEAAFDDDNKFAATIDRLRDDRTATRAALNDCLNEMFGLDRSLTKSRTKDLILQDIEDERLVRVRHSKAAAYMSNKQPIKQD